MFWSNLTECDEYSIILIKYNSLLRLYSKHFIHGKPFSLHIS
jgi:hypothetical protein